MPIYSPCADLLSKQVFFETFKSKAFFTESLMEYKIMNCFISYFLPDFSSVPAIVEI